MTDRVTHGTLHQDIGALQARMDALEKAQEQNAATLKEIRDKVIEIRGGRKALTFLVTAAAAVGAAAAWMLEHIALK